jgi:signal peptidase II
MPDVNSNVNVRPWWHWLAISVVVAVLDQWTKGLILRAFADGESITITSFFNLVLAYNKGAAFSFLAGAGGWQRGFFITLAIVISAFLLWMMRTHPRNRLLCVALALVFGGAMGNLYDRVALGHVVDFIQLHAAGYYWPAFNVADSSIFVGAVLLVLDSFRKQPANADAASQGQ